MAGWTSRIVLCLTAATLAGPAGVVVAQETASRAVADSATTAGRFYGGVEYLHWWMKDAPLSVPLVSTGPVTSNQGVLTETGVTILYGAPFSPAAGGNASQGFPPASGGRLTLGYFLDDAQTLAVEARYFRFASQSAGYQASGNSSERGGYGIGIPIFNTVAFAGGGLDDLSSSESAFPVSITGILSGKVVIRNSVELWGTDATVVRNLARSDSWEVAGLAGFRYLNLSEGFGLTDSIVGTSARFLTQSGTVSDSFNTYNHFYGAGIGLRGKASYGPFFASLSGRVSLGVSNEVLSVGGAYWAVNSTPASGPEGIFAQPSNSGTRVSNNFAVVPEVEIKVGYEIYPGVQLTVGYDFLYYSSVVRPGDQLSHSVPKSQIFQQGGTSVSSTSPASFFRKTGFYAQGLSTGITVRF